MGRKEILEDPFLMESFLSYLNNPTISRHHRSYMNAIYLNQDFKSGLLNNDVFGNREHFLTNDSATLNAIVGNFWQEFRQDRIDDLLNQEK